jgi:hypothetical protein
MGLTKDEYEQQRRRLHWIGLSGTAIWIVAGASLFLDRTWETLRDSPLSDSANFLAGFFAPLAFFWLVLTYFLQSLELRMQREQLDLQRIEQKRLADEASKQATAVADNEIHMRRDLLIKLYDLGYRELTSTAISIIPPNFHRTLESFVYRVSIGDNYAVFDALSTILGHVEVQSHFARNRDDTVRKMKRFIDIYDYLNKQSVILGDEQLVALLEKSILHKAVADVRRWLTSQGLLGAL